MSTTAIGPDRTAGRETAGPEVTPVHQHKIRVRAADGAESDATLFDPDPGPPRATIVCTPAMGIGARHYEALAGELARRGFGVLTVELRGVGSSSVRARLGVDFGYRELVLDDLPAAIAAARGIFPAAPLVLLGHSVGAHVSALYASLAPDGIAGLVFVAAGTSFFRSWRFPLNVGMLLVAQLTRTVSRLLGYFPGRRFGLFGTEARRLMLEWSTLTTRGRFAVAECEHDFEEALPKVTLPVLALSFEGDLFAPVGAVEHLLSKLPRAGITHRHLRAADLGATSVDHFRWAKYPAPIADAIARWIGA
jgi:predicted alpha/beta hydrolase